ncbi:MAG: hypothetical protein WBX01_10715 [Nitrososphaeraceae archaeon]
MNKTIFVGMVIGVLAIYLVAPTVANACQPCCPTAFLDRANNNLDRHIEAGGIHGDAAQKIKDRLNDGGGCSGG